LVFHGIIGSGTSLLVVWLGGGWGFVFGGLRAPPQVKRLRAPSLLKPPLEVLPLASIGRALVSSPFSLCPPLVESVLARTFSGRQAMVVFLQRSGVVPPAKARFASKLALPVDPIRDAPAAVGSAASSSLRPYRFRDPAIDNFDRFLAPFIRDRARPPSLLYFPLLGFVGAFVLFRAVGAERLCSPA